MIAIVKKEGDEVSRRTYECVHIILDPWEEDCTPKIAAMLGTGEEYFIARRCHYNMDRFTAKKDELQFICVAKIDDFPGYTIYRRQIDIERLVRWEQGNKQKLRPEEWS